MAARYHSTRHLLMNLFLAIRNSRTRTSGWLSMVLVIVFLFATPPRSSSLGGRLPADTLRILFVGNSLTYFNDLPSIVEALAEANDQRLAYKMIAFADFSLEDHWNKGDAGKAIKNGKWNYVVLQQGPSASKEGRAVLREYARRFAEEIRRTGARPALYMVWPSSSRAQDFAGVSQSYSQAAEDIDALVLPVGEAWLSAWRINPKIELYSKDGLHPTVTGSYLAALVIYGQLSGRPLGGLPSKLSLRSKAKIEIPVEQAEQLQRAASEANGKFARR